MATLKRTRKGIKITFTEQMSYCAFVAPKGSGYSYVVQRPLKIGDTYNHSILGKGVVDHAEEVEGLPGSYAIRVRTDGTTRETAIAGDRR